MILHYFYDPLCGWCYGFSNVLKNFYENHKDEFDVEVISGGMVRGESERPIGDMADYLKDAFKQVEKVSGVKFGEKFHERVQKGTEVFSSIPGSIALSVFKSFQEEKALYFASELQKAIYYDGVSPSDKGHFAEIASQFGIVKSEFMKMMDQDYFKKDAYDDFSVTQQFGIKGYPSCVLFAKDEYFLLNHGFTNLENLEKTYNSIVHSIV